ncbi:hypothetical protein CNR34_00145 [Pseudomonas phage nickie]|uniref:Uncharacterized protein n=1 Tax=Pseudomonas phage nickie TaxID=2048977 RepID=A0A2H4P7D0_9CAUD|nr:hypothetical protein FDJ16_gp020 [Pseudomonas phage nickie]ATW58078.1 hypothetical protein CNR34_00145 [Pseudomonas phage nickie]
MMSMIFAVVCVFVFLGWAWSEFKRDVLGVKTYYRWDELVEQDRLKAEKWEARKLAFKKFFGKV